MTRTPRVQTCGAHPHMASNEAKRQEAYRDNERLRAGTFFVLVDLVYAMYPH